MSGIISWICLTSAISALQLAPLRWQKRAQQESGEERVTAKSRRMMNLTARMPSFVSSSASSNPGRTSYGYQDPGKSVAGDHRTGKLVESWFTTERGKLVSENLQGQAHFEKFIMGSEIAEFVNKVRDPSTTSTEKKCRAFAESCTEH